MTPFTYRRAASIDEAIEMAADDGGRLLGGGTNLLDLMRKGVERPSRLADVTTLSNTIEMADDGSLVIGAAARNSAVAAHAAGRSGNRLIPVIDFHRLPGERPDIETALEPGEVIVAVEIPASPFARRSAYRKVRDRASYAFALVSVAAGLSMDGDTIGDIRIAFGGIAPKPWRAFRAEAALRGQRVTAQAVKAAMADEFAKAEPLAGNAFKVELAERTLRAVLAELSGSDR